MINTSVEKVYALQANPLFIPLFIDALIHGQTCPEPELKQFIIIIHWLSFLICDGLLVQEIRRHHFGLWKKMSHFLSVFSDIS